MKINAAEFRASAVIYQFLLGGNWNKVPHSPEHAHRARYLAGAISAQCKGDATYTLAAAHALCGYLQNPTSAHAPDVELINLALHGANQLVSAFASQSAQEHAQAARAHAPIVAGMAMPTQSTMGPALSFGPPEMPQQSVPQMPVPTQPMQMGLAAAIPPPDPPVPLGVSANIPDFT